MNLIKKFVTHESSSNRNEWVEVKGSWCVLLKKRIDLYWSLKYPLKGKLKKQSSHSGVTGHWLVPHIERKIHSPS